MAEILFILEAITLPIILLIAGGYILQKVFKFDKHVFSKLTLYYLVPSVMFMKLYSADISWDFLLQVVPYTILMQICLYFLSLLFSAIFRFNNSLRSAFANSMVLTNTGNYGIPLINLVFNSNSVAVASQIFILTLQNITASSFGVMQATSKGESRKKALLNIVKMPVFYVLILVALIRLLNISLPVTLTIPMGYLANAFVGIALTTLGVQLADIKIRRNLGKVTLVSIIKVLTAPIVGFALTQLLSIEGILGAALVIGLSTPTAINAATLALEFGNEPEFSAQVVFMTTILCTLTLPAVIYLTRVFFLG